MVLEPQEIKRIFDRRTNQFMMAFARRKQQVAIRFHPGFPWSKAPIFSLDFRLFTFFKLLKNKNW